MKDKEWLWVADPLDGTTNFVYSLPFCAISICIIHKVKAHSLLDFLVDSHDWRDL